ncbi:MAG: NIPSNAP family protein [Candidatus Eiseniibacteriota bacterium]
MRRLIEIRSYNLLPGSRDEFHRLVVEKSMPLLQKWKVDVVDFGPSPHDDDSYYLIRAYANLSDREASQDAFYGSDDWKQGPRDEILPLIESHTSIVLELDDETVNAMRRAKEGNPRGAATG